MSRHFTVAQAGRLLPEMEPAMRRGVAIRKSHTEVEAELRSAAQRIVLLGGSRVDQQRILNQRTHRDALAARLQEFIDEIQRHGCLIKDLDVGLLDFPTWFRDTEVYLCWRLGEPAIAFWHGIEEGFRGRKKIDQDFLDHHRGDEDCL